MLREAMNKDRGGWKADFIVKGGRAIGRLLNGDEVVRDAFNVRIASDGTFQVDIGTGSGVKIRFNTGA